MLAFAGAATLTNAHKVVIRINKVDNERGQIGVVVFGKDNYMKTDHPTWATLTDPIKGTTTVTADLPNGQYAILVMHDENKNQRPDMDGNGIPTEPTGMSNNPELHAFPTFDQLAVNIQGNTTIDIDMVRYK